MKPKKKDDMEKYIHEVGEPGDASSTAAAQECTGLFAAAPENAEEYAHGMELYQTEVPGDAPAALPPEREERQEPWRPRRTPGMG